MPNFPFLLLALPFLFANGLPVSDENEDSVVDPIVEVMRDARNGINIPDNQNVDDAEAQHLEYTEAALQEASTQELELDSSVPCKGAHFQCFQERAYHGHRLQAVGAKCADLVKVFKTHTSAQLGCSGWYDTLTLAEGQGQLDILRRDTKLNFVRPKGGNTIALENSFEACGSWGVQKSEKIYALLAFTTPSVCLRDANNLIDVARDTAGASCEATNTNDPWPRGNSCARIIKGTDTWGPSTGIHIPKGGSFVVKFASARSISSVELKQCHSPYITTTYSIAYTTCSNPRASEPDPCAGLKNVQLGGTCSAACAWKYCADYKNWNGWRKTQCSKRLGGSKRGQYTCYWEGGGSYYDDRRRLLAVDDVEESVADESTCSWTTLKTYQGSGVSQQTTATFKTVTATAIKLTSTGNTAQDNWWRITGVVVMGTGRPVDKEKWATCSVQVGGTDVPNCPVNQLCNHNGYVGKFITWPVSGKTECYCKYDGGTKGYPCKGNTCYCAKQTQAITVAPVQELNLPEIMFVGSTEFFLVGSDGCPCPEDPKWKGIAPATKASPQACAEHCSATNSCSAIFWDSQGMECWLNTSPFIRHNSNSFCPDDVKTCGEYEAI